MSGRLGDRPHAESPRARPLEPLLRPCVVHSFCDFWHPLPPPPPPHPPPAPSFLCKSHGTRATCFAGADVGNDASIRAISLSSERSDNLTKCGASGARCGLPAATWLARDSSSRWQRAACAGQIASSFSELGGGGDEAHGV
ncbi:unnamed protein product [Prorocentrum cordatum]|uniref:Subtilisin n=1 Tax=Prorocentrum cordatum TaxID=2364126 RepID=A0ABN9PAT9_9DINO|nr:unnamed protein product [Polarella glacialis]